MPSPTFVSTPATAPAPAPEPAPAPTIPSSISISIPPSHEGDTTLALASLAPYSSDGPTLPLIGGVSERASSSAKANGRRNASSGDGDDGGEDEKEKEKEEVGGGHGRESAGRDGRARKKRKVSGEEEGDGGDGDGDGSVEGKEKEKEEKTETEIDKTKAKKAKQAKVQYEHLRKPWLSLPPSLLTAVQTRLGFDIASSSSSSSFSWQDRCVPIVCTKNSSVKSGVRRLEAYLGCGAGNGNGNVEVPEMEREMEMLSRGEGLIAVSAMGAAVSKVVGVLDVVRRAVGEGETVRWWMYTGLSCWVGDAGEGEEGDGVEGEDTGGVEGEDTSGDREVVMRDVEKDLEAGKDSREDQGQGMDKNKNRGKDREKGGRIPVLTVWLCRKSLPEFKKVFGEQSFEVVGMRGCESGGGG
ncbi:hypothetical protein CC80DRAFT_544846 [Byssothecium circinans]|uniref:Uncharacterized protein n=1 Tax=Byssothecium circinans TaxID=147558 RepID=A0A6A5UBX8_9PLEO|nr:hypothetical protein CC80DRAFT_544846 [Byssothecium circinans]